MNVSPSIRRWNWPLGLWVTVPLLLFVTRSSVAPASIADALTLSRAGILWMVKALSSSEVKTAASSLAPVITMAKVWLVAPAEEVAVGEKVYATPSKTS